MKKLFILFLCFPVLAQAQTWDRVFKSAQRAVTKPHLTLSASRRALRQARQTLGVLPPTLQPWRDGQQAAFTSALSPRLNGWAALSNRLAAKETALRRAQIQFFTARQALPAGQWLALPARTEALAGRIKSPVSYVVAGGRSKDGQSFTAFAKLVKTYHQQNPNRQILVFLEMLPDQGMRFASPHHAPEPLQRYVKPFAQSRLAVVGLGDRSYQPSGYLMQENSTLLVPAGEAPASVSARCAHMRVQLGKWRKAYPQAVFFIYTTRRAAAYDTQYSLANRLPPENTFVVSITSVRNTRNFLFHRWTDFKQVRAGVYAWKDAQWARMSGFDAQVILP